MALTLLYITNDIQVARIAEESGVDWIFVDLEIHGKAARQAGRNTVISGHSVEDVYRMRAALTRSRLLVRVNPIGVGSEMEIEQVIDGGADILMLPFFKTVTEVERFVASVNGRAKTCLLLETPEAVDHVEAILSATGIDYVHIGLNDLHIAYRMRFMFEPLADGTVDRLCTVIARSGIPYGFGGIARIGKLRPPAETIVAEHYRLGSSMVILSRSFCHLTGTDQVGLVEESFRTGVAEIRAWERELEEKDSAFFDENRRYVRDEILKVAREAEP